MFSQACVKNSVHKRGGGHAWQEVCVVGGACMAGGMPGKGGMHDRGCVWRGGHVWQERQPLQRTVRILLECILVLYINGNQYHVRVFLCKRLPLLIF